MRTAGVLQAGIPEDFSEQENIMDMTTTFQDAINDFLIIVIAVAVILVLVVILGSKKSRFRRKFEELFPQDTIGSAGHKMEFNKEYYITGEKNMRIFSK